MEEVAFRGAVDAHAHHDGEERRWASAAFVAMLWDRHLPVSSGFPLPVMAVELVVVHIAWVWLSYAWHRTRSLASSALAHAVIDAVRNATMLGL